MSEFPRTAPRVLLVIWLALGSGVHLTATQPLPPPDLPAPWKTPENSLEKNISAVAISPNGKVVATVKPSSRDALTFYDRDSGKVLRRISRCSYKLFTFSHDSKHFITSCMVPGRPFAKGERYEVLIYEVATGKLVRRFPLAERQGHNAYSFATADKVLFVAGENEVGTLYDLDTGKALGNLPGKHRAKAVALSHDGKWLLTAGKDDLLCVWDVRKRDLLHDLYRHTDLRSPGRAVHAIGISGDGAWCASLTSDKRLWVFDRAKAQERARLDVLMMPKLSSKLFFSTDGKTLLATGSGAHHGLTVWDWQSSKQPRGGYPRGGLIERNSIFTDEPKKWNPGQIMDASMSAEGTLLAWGPYKSLYLWRPTEPSPEPTVRRKPRPKIR